MEIGKHGKGRKSCSLLLLVIAVRIVSTKDLAAAVYCFVFLGFPELVSQSSLRAPTEVLTSTKQHLSSEIGVSLSQATSSTGTSWAAAPLQKSGSQSHRALSLSLQSLANLTSCFSRLRESCFLQVSSMCQFSISCSFFQFSKHMLNQFLSIHSRFECIVCFCLLNKMSYFWNKG